jgi:hypothetical protein
LLSSVDFLLCVCLQDNNKPISVVALALYISINVSQLRQASQLNNKIFPQEIGIRRYSHRSYASILVMDLLLSRIVAFPQDIFPY